jgi:hypothetical protein
MERGDLYKKLVLPFRGIGPFDDGEDIWMGKVCILFQLG